MHLTEKDRPVPAGRRAAWHRGVSGYTQHHGARGRDPAERGRGRVAGCERRGSSYSSAGSTRPGARDWSRLARVARTGQCVGSSCSHPGFRRCRGWRASSGSRCFYWLHQSRRDLILQSPADDGAIRGTFSLRSPWRDLIGTSIAQADRDRGRHGPGRGPRLHRRHAAPRPQAAPAACSRRSPRRRRGISRPRRGREPSSHRGRRKNCLTGQVLGLLVGAGRIPLEKGIGHER